MFMGTTTKLIKAGGVAVRSLRTTVPISVIEQLDLNPGDVFDWDIRSQNGDKYVIVKKV